MCLALDARQNESEARYKEEKEWIGVRRLWEGKGREEKT
jgi:hypothetical protein